MKWYLFHILVALDCLCNAILGGNPQETMSSRMGKHLVKHEKCPVCNFLCKILNLIDSNHCIKNIEPDRGESL